MNYSIQPAWFDGSIIALLQSNHLLTSDIEAGTEVSLFAAGSDQELSGVVGIQVFGPTALLRSLAVSETERGKGLGTALVRRAEEHAVSLGIGSIYLLTMTAKQFFEAQGYSTVNRKEAPTSIAGTCQFSRLCPSSSAFMVKVLACPTRH
ncbi:arsenic resistance N-acetyltransferase ArsN2 [Synechococcus sp. CCY 9618]|uniref:arsenic resistance N-acetyltransferase ArsN2 n=1 Tax=Synechococcus sp. CCY 9618 TaxID=2815602 RepID=UPI001C21FEA3|nr:arsenic resistance N-acetyltransferase ArsN2 [Synechococcus sp. CCY 9618]